jgi:hypothetical protein
MLLSIRAKAHPRIGEISAASLQLLKLDNRARDVPSSRGHPELVHSLTTATGCDRRRLGIVDEREATREKCSFTSGQAVAGIVGFVP